MREKTCGHVFVYTHCSTTIEYWKIETSNNFDRLTMQLTDHFAAVAAEQCTCDCTSLKEKRTTVSDSLSFISFCSLILYWLLCPLVLFGKCKHTHICNVSKCLCGWTGGCAQILCHLLYGNDKTDRIFLQTFLLLLVKSFNDFVIGPSSSTKSSLYKPYFIFKPT